jgi:hypothetical protein
MLGQRRVVVDDEDAGPGAHPSIVAPARLRGLRRDTIAAMSEPAGWASPSGWSPPPSAPPSEFPTPPGWGGPSAGGWGAPRPPEVRPGVVPLRPLGLGELLDGAVGVIRRYPRPCLGLSAAIAVLSTIVNVALALTAFAPLLEIDQTSLSDGNTDQLDGVLGGAALGGGGGAIISALATLVLTGVLTAVVGKAVLGQPMTAGQAWAQVRPALPRLLGIALLTALIVYGTVTIGVGLIAVAVAVAGRSALWLAIPLAIAVLVLAVHLYVRLSLAPAAAVLEGSGVRQSLRRSGVLVRRSWWRICGILLLTLVIASFVSQVLQIPFLLFGAGPTGFSRLTDPNGSTSRVLVLSYIGAGFAQTLVAPFTAGVRALLYVDRRMRAEGLDVALTAAVAPPPS